MSIFPIKGAAKLTGGLISAYVGGRIGCYIFDTQQIKNEDDQLLFCMTGALCGSIIGAVGGVAIIASMLS
jgi:hypothetical protein